MKHKSLNYSKTIAIIMALCVLPAAANARSTTLLEPDPAKINCTLTVEKMKEGIVKGSAVRGWVIVNQTPGSMELKYVKGAYKHTITVNVNYTKDTFAITYKDSTNLNYNVSRNGTRRIHPRPIGWMKNLNVDIQMSANKLCYE